MTKPQLSKYLYTVSYMCSSLPVPLCELAILRLHLHDIDIDMVDKLHSLTNRCLGLHNQILDNNTDKKAS